MDAALRQPVTCESIEPTRAVSNLSDDVVDGLVSRPRSLPPKYFYDERGSLLFDRICDVPEYYPTRTESALLERIAGDVISREQPECIVELGSGTSRKTRHLLDACDVQNCHSRYAPIDVCDEILVSSGRALREEYPWLDVQPLVGDYTAGLGNLPEHEGRKLVVFLGGTIGNFSRDEARDFLAEVRETMRDGDSLLIGADRVKPPEFLHAAYNDTAGVTAEFNLNVLQVLNRELGADFDLAGFEHYAHFNPLESQIEMHLIAMKKQSVHVAAIDRTLEFVEGDHILTEISRKFTRHELEQTLIEAGFRIVEHFESDPMTFSLVLAHPD